MESTYRLKLVSPVGPLPMLLLGGEGRLHIEGGQVSLLDGWVKFRADDATANQVQRIRASLQSSFQTFCANPDQIPNAQTMAFLDQVAALLSEEQGGSQNGGMKRAASWSAEGADDRGPASRLMPKMPGKGMKGGGKGYKGGWKGGKSQGKGW
ncbi:unnamed protein product [Symbiodinium sp. CCMP2592]|nr:unnamed protein product [Symbiodinium sp. CCMP2592]